MSAPMLAILVIVNLFILYILFTQLGNADSFISKDKVIEHIIDKETYTDHIIKISKTVVVEQADIEKVYEKCLSWLLSVKAEIISEEKPNHIIAIHFQDFLTRPEGIQGGKRFFISFTRPQGPFPEIYPSNTVVNMKVGHIRHDGLYTVAYHSSPWLEFVEDLWRYLGVSMDDDLLRKIYTEKDLKSVRNQSLSHVLLIAACTVGLLICSIIVFFWNALFSLSVILFLLFVLKREILPYYRHYLHNRTKCERLFPKS